MRKMRPIMDVSGIFSCDFADTKKYKNGIEMVFSEGKVGEVGPHMFLDLAFQALSRSSQIWSFLSSSTQYSRSRSDTPKTAHDSYSD